MLHDFFSCAMERSASQLSMIQVSGCNSKNSAHSAHLCESHFSQHQLPFDTIPCVKWASNGVLPRLTSTHHASSWYVCCSCENTDALYALVGPDLQGLGIKCKNLLRGTVNPMIWHSFTVCVCRDANKYQVCRHRWSYSHLCSSHHILCRNFAPFGCLLGLTKTLVR